MKVREATIAFDALSHNMRVKIFRKLIKRGKSGIGARELCKDMDIPPATLSFHMSKLLNGDLVDMRKKGKFITYTANLKQVTKLSEFLMEKCCAEDITLPGSEQEKGAAMNSFGCKDSPSGETDCS